MNDNTMTDKEKLEYILAEITEMLGEDPLVDTTGWASMGKLKGSLEHLQWVIEEAV